MTVQPDDSAVSDRVHQDPSFEKIAEAACARLAKNERVRRNLPGGGRLRMDRQLPFLCVYRSPPNGSDRGTRELVTTSAAYLFASGDSQYHEGINTLCQRIVTAMQEHFGTFLLLEIWAQPLPSSPPDEGILPAPGFEIHSSDPESLPSTLDAFIDALAEVKVHGLSANVTTHCSDRVAPPHLPKLLLSESGELPQGCCQLGVAVKPIYRDSESGDVFPILLQRLRWQVAKALRKAIAQFTGIESGSKKVHYDSLGPSSMVKAVRIIDQELCEVAESFDFLLQVTPTNSTQAWEEFSEGGYRTSPLLHYRPLPYHPNLLKRRLFNIEIERIEDPTLGHIFWEKQEELDRQLSALRNLDTPEFLPNSLQLYGKADDDLVALARGILAQAPESPGLSSLGERVNTKTFLARVRDEIEHYHERLNAFNAKVEVCDSIAAGVMVTHEKLLIANDLALRPERVEPLLHHEIGTHLLTYFNGRCQPFRQLYTGLAGYEELQEGLAVFAEYLSGGLTVHRLKTLAGRVIAVRSMTDGVTFPQAFSRLHDEFGLSPRKAFVTTLRAYRGGGLTKDVIYLRGLRELHSHLAAGHDIEPLYVGKIGLHHLPYLQEMRRRGIIDAPCILPRFWDDERLRKRLEACRELTFLELLESCL